MFFTGKFDLTQPINLLKHELENSLLTEGRDFPSIVPSKSCLSCQFVLSICQCVSEEGTVVIGYRTSERKGVCNLDVIEQGAGGESEDGRRIPGCHVFMIPKGFLHIFYHN